jgi:hypothetical protein
MAVCFYIRVGWTHQAARWMSASTLPDFVFIFLIVAFAMLPPGHDCLAPTSQDASLDSKLFRTPSLAHISILLNLKTHTAEISSNLSHLLDTRLLQPEFLLDFATSSSYARGSMGSFGSFGNGPRSSLVSAGRPSVTISRWHRDPTHADQLQSSCTEQRE